VCKPLSEREEDCVQISESMCRPEGGDAGLLAGYRASDRVAA